MSQVDVYMDLEEIEEAATAPVAIERKKHAGKGKAATESQLSNLALGRAKRAGMKAAKAAEAAEAEEKAVKKALVTKPPPPPPPSPPPSPEPVKQQLVKPRQRKAEPEPEPEPVKKKKKKQVIIVEADSSSDEDPQVIYKTKRKVATPPAPVYEEPLEIPRLRRA